MLKKLLVLFTALYATLAMAAVDANKASADELPSVKGIGPATASHIVEARQQGQFRNWDDFIARVKGVAHTSAAKLSEAGLTINGQTYGATQKATQQSNKPAEKSAKPAQSAGKKPEKS